MNNEDSPRYMWHIQWWESALNNGLASILDEEDIEDKEWFARRWQKDCKWFLDRLQFLLAVGESLHSNDRGAALLHLPFAQSASIENLGQPKWQDGSNVKVDCVTLEQGQEASTFHQLIAYLMYPGDMLHIPVGQEEAIWNFSCFVCAAEKYFSDECPLTKDHEVTIYKKPYMIDQAIKVLDKWKSPYASKGLNEGLMQLELDYHVFKHFIMQAPFEARQRLFDIGNNECGLFSDKSWQLVEFSVNFAGRGSPPRIVVGSLKLWSSHEVVELCFGKSLDSEQDGSG